MTDIQKNHETSYDLPGAFSLFRPSYNAFLLNVWTFLGLIGTPITLAILAGIFGSIAKNSNDTFLQIVSTVLVLCAFIFNLFAYPSFPYVHLQGAKGEEVSIGEALRHGKKFFWRFWGLFILVNVVVIVGLALLIVPGLFMLRRYLLAQYYLYDKRVGVLAAMRQSANDSKKFSLAIWGLLGVLILLILPLFVPLLSLVSFVLLLTYSCAPAIRYLQIQHAKRH